ncbi:right-handed parallel beta-helix repeat-containing protein [Allohahella marinimesophila]|uniref:Type III secretion-associated outer membrane-bound protein HpaM n=1 Tax=Allohahella marinimesophila TaxID=1054972 RepID=A0ABP7P2M1_9GAMM
MSGMQLALFSGLINGLLMFSQFASAAATPPCTRQLTPDDDLAAVFRNLPEQGDHQTLCLGAGDYHLDGMVEIRRSQVTLRGEGKEKTFLRMKAGVSSPVLVIGDAHHQEPDRTISNVRIEALAIRGSRESTTEFFPSLPYLSNSALIVRRGANITLQDLDVRHCRSACVLTEYNSSDILLANSHISDAQWDGISLNRAGPTSLVGNTIRDNVAAGITVEYMTASVFRNNIIAGNGSHGVYLADAEHNEIRDNEIEDNHLAGIFLTCSIQDHEAVQCWEGSISRDNRFIDNVFSDNRFGYQVAVDQSANCLGWDSPRNVSSGDSFLLSPNHEPSWENFGRCLSYQGSHTVR